MRAIDHKTGIWSLSLGQIEGTVAAHLGPGRVPGQEQHHCLSRQISMCLAKHIGGWSTTKIGRFYNGRHYTTVLHAIRKVERLRAADESVEARSANRRIEPCGDRPLGQRAGNPSGRPPSLKRSRQACSTAWQNFKKQEAMRHSRAARLRQRSVSVLSAQLT
jgi:hypothetical protein